MSRPRTREQQFILPTFDPEDLRRLSRRRDPEPSRLAIATMTESGARRTDLEIVLGLVRQSNGRTYRELHEIHVRNCRQTGEKPLQDVAIMRRLTDLAERHPMTGDPLPSAAIVRGPDRECTVGRTPMQTWWVRGTLPSTKAAP